jgi:predicted DCC family thiol-disulfide oxidoreductase YuxK
MSNKDVRGEGFQGKTIVLFDGVCRLCNRTVQFLLKRDRRHFLYFAPLQGKTAGEIFQRHPSAAGNQTIVLVQYDHTSKEKLFYRSDAVIRTLASLGGFWKVVTVIRMFPLFLRDAFYNFIARHRYFWFGKQNECAAPSSKDAARFLP